MADEELKELETREKQRRSIGLREHGQETALRYGDVPTAFRISPTIRARVMERAGVLADKPKDSKSSKRSKRRR